MKKLIFTISLILSLLPSVVSASTVPLNRIGTNEYTLYPTDTLNSFLFNATSSTAASVFPYASTTVISSSGSVFFGTNTGTTNSFNYFLGTTSAPLQTTTGSAANIGNFLVLPKVNTANPGFLVTTMTGLQSNSASVLPIGSGPCHGWYEGSTGTGRLMAADCVQYFNPVSFIGASRLNFIADPTGVTRPYWYVDQNGNAALESTTTGALTARFTVGNINSSTQDIVHFDQPIAFATTTVGVITSTGRLGLGSTSPMSQLTVSQNSITNGNVGTIERIDSQTLGGFSVNGSGFTTAYTTNSNLWGAVGGYSNGNIGFGIWKPVIGTVTVSGAPQIFVDVTGTVGVASTSPSTQYQMAIAGTGGLYVGGKIYATSTVQFTALTAFASGDSAVCVKADGTITSDTGVTSCIVSTKTAKHDIKSSETVSSLQRIMKLNPVAFEYNENNKKDIGLIAEEVAAVDARYAQYDPKTLKPKAINWAAITSDLIKTTQDQENRIEALEKLNGIKPNNGSVLPTVLATGGLLVGAGGIYLSKKKKT